MAFKRSAPIAFYAKALGPSGSASERASHLREVVRVRDAIRKADSRLAHAEFRTEMDESHTEELWVRHEDPDAVFSKAELRHIAEAVGAIRPEIDVWVWIQDDEEHEHGWEIFRDTIKPDEYKRD